MSVTLLLDEHIEREVYERLEQLDHDVERVDHHETLDRSTSDRKLAAYSLEHQALVVTYDDDFRTKLSESDYWGVLFVPDESCSPRAVARAIDRIITLYDERTLAQMNLVGREWME